MIFNRLLMASGTKAYTATASSSGTTFTMESLFTSGQWTSTVTKTVIIPNAVHLGSSNASSALTIGATAWGGDLILEVQSGGIISGSGGAAGTSGAGGVGGNAFDANRLGASSQKVIVNILAGGTIRGGGGGGGKGGVGGAGTFRTQEGPTLQNTPYGAYYYWQDGGNAGAVWNNSGSAYLGYPAGTTLIGPFSGWMYARGNFYGGQTYYVYRYYDTGTSGGAGGNGGRGQGYDGANASGSAGAAGGTNAGTGGTGGTGATYGNTGNTGNTGAAGNAGAGVTGSSGGLAGYYIANRAANATVNNSGTVQGR